jgi:cytochrome c-type biogenesis protein CcmE
VRHARLKLSLGAAVVVLALGLLAYAGIREARLFYLEVDTFLAEARFHEARVRLCGTVAEEGLEADPSELGARFVLQGQRGRLRVVYRGVVPELFKPGAEIVAEGRLDETGVFEATQLLTKCASKYKPEDYGTTEGGA